jgi:hypothetical protein
MLYFSCSDLPVLDPQEEDESSLLFSPGAVFFV